MQTISPADELGEVIDELLSGLSLQTMSRQKVVYSSSSGHGTI
jgi:hypothetical protein